MSAASLIRESRLAAGLTQAELAARLGVTQPTVASWERPASNPTVRTLERALAASGRRLVTSASALPAVDETQIAERLRLSAAERLDLFTRSQQELRGLTAVARRVPR